MKNVTPRWLIGWSQVAIQIILSQIFLTAPFIPIIWVLWNWIAVGTFGAPHLSFLEAAGLLFLLKFLQSNAIMMHPEAGKPEVEKPEPS